MTYSAGWSSKNIWLRHDNGILYAGDDDDGDGADVFFFFLVHIFKWPNDHLFKQQSNNK